jgi:hypothetical protein
VTRERLLAARINQVRELIANESSSSKVNGVLFPPVEIVAVTKAASDEDFLSMASMGLPLAENRWGQLSSRELLAKNAGKNPSFHFIGALQRRSTKERGTPVSLISTVDREGILPILENMALSHGVTQNILVEINLSGIEGRSGVSSETLPVLLDAISRTRSLLLKGILVMGVPPSPSGDLSESRRIFGQGKDLYDWLAGQWPGIDTLSMGMSGDFLEAVRAGSTQIRLGTILFGKEEIIGNGHSG